MEDSWEEEGAETEAEGACGGCWNAGGFGEGMG